MRWILARRSASSPTELAYFTGSMTAVQTDEGLYLSPGTGFFLADAFIFPSLAIAGACVTLLDQHMLGTASFMVLPYVGDAAT
ncbi:MAG TPA: hypothetical protein VNX29_04325 [Kaistia sp.]|nr:hypothetical protein [Kaistia sp.]